VILTSIEFDHADIYRDLDHVIASFEKLMALVPGDGMVAVCADDEVARRTAALTHAAVESYGFHEDATWRIVNVREDETGYRFGLLRKGKPAGDYHTKMLGRHNLSNITATIAVAHRLWKEAGKTGEAAGPIAEALRDFRGVRRRQELLLEAPVRVVDDFAHHPTAVAVTLDGIRKRFPKGRLWAFFEPRSATARRAVHQEDYAKAFDAADVVLLAVPYKAGELGDQKLDAEALAARLRARGKAAEALENADAILGRFLKEYAPGDVAVVMSNGEFGKLQVKLVDALKRQA
jgi:UDP-N-acetylmuramate: L-alanyl-gamma-D-glutamyl-meso-diaminopimelate ligase